jgi:very-short-patch-repair endonuclease
MTAGEINDLYNTSPLENALWHVFRSEGIPAERQWHETVGARNYFLDFAIHCATGKIDVETDGDTWHANPAAAKRDNRRDNDLETAGWHVIRFTSKRIREEVEDYCLDTVVKAANRLGGIENGGVVPRQAGKSAGAYQARLFDDQ